MTMAKNKKPPEYGDDSTFDRPPPYNPYYGDQASGAGAPPPPGIAPTTPYPNQPPPEYQPNPGFVKAPVPPQPNRIVAQQTGTSTVIQPVAATVTNVQIHISDEFGPYAQHAICPKCRQYVVTKTKPVAGALTWLSCLGLFMIGCDLGCCFIPCCVDSCRDVIHKCPNCGRHIGRFKRIC